MDIDIEKLNKLESLVSNKTANLEKNANLPCEEKQAKIIAAGKAKLAELGLDENGKPLADNKAQDDSDETKGAGNDNWDFVPKPAPPPFKVFPKGMQPLIYEMQQAFSAKNSIFAALLILNATVINGHFSTRLYSKKPQSGNEFIILIGESGVGKTDPVEFLLEPFKDFCAIKFNQWQLDEERKKRERKELEKRIRNKEIQRDEVDFDSLEPSRPPNRLAAYDITLEGLSDQLANKPPYFTVGGDELMTVINKLDINVSSKMKRINEAALDSSFLSLFDGIDWGTVRVNKNVERNNSVRKAYISLYGGIQPDLFPRVFTKADMINGLLGRCIIVREENDDKDDFNEFYFSDEVKELVKNLTFHFLNIPHQYREDTGELIQIFIPFTKEAQKYYVTWHREKKNDAKVRGRQFLFNKISMHTTRFILWLHLLYKYFGEISSDKIEVDIVEKGIIFGEWLYKEIFVIWDILEARENCDDIKFIDLKSNEKLILNTILQLDVMQFTNKDIAEYLGAKSEMTVYTIGRTIAKFNSIFGRAVFLKTNNGKVRGWEINKPELDAIRKKLNFSST